MFILNSPYFQIYYINRFLKEQKHNCTHVDYNQLISLTIKHIHQYFSGFKIFECLCNHMGSVLFLLIFNRSIQIAICFKIKYFCEKSYHSLVGNFSHIQSHAHPLPSQHLYACTHKCTQHICIPSSRVVSMTTLLGSLNINVSV